MPEKAILVGANTNNNKDFDYQMEELHNLCIACEIDVVDSVTQNLEAIHPQTYIGKGKLEEIKIAINSHDADVIVFNDELSASQIKKLESILEITIYDRTYIILEIFKSRAQTKEAMLQVDIASLRYLMPRLIGLRKGLSRQRGVGGDGARGRGQGETKLELDRRNISDRIAFLNKELIDLTKQRSLQRNQRKQNEVPVVCLVGYTNSGKSSLMNAILTKSTDIKKNVIQEDMLFATLETSSRKIKLLNNHQFVITDTVGFISKLPHQLIEAFKSTLEEIKEASLIVHVVDSSNPNADNQISITNEVLTEIGVKDIPMIYAFNKIDKSIENYISPNYSDVVYISAKHLTNIDSLIELIEDKIYSQDQKIQLKLPYDKANIVNTLKEKAHITTLEYNDDCIVVEALVSPILRNKLIEYIEK